MKIKIQIKSIWGTVLFEAEKEDYTVKRALRDAVLRDAVLRGADLRDADLRDADLSGAVLSGADLRDAVLSGADLRDADLSGAVLSDAVLRGADLRGADLSGAVLRDAVLSGADLRDADLSGIPIANLPKEYVELCSRDILYVLEHLKAEVPFLKEKLLSGEVNGTAYKGDCACLVGSLANAKNEDYQTVCSVIPFYTPNVHNPGEQWFLQISKGDTPADNEFSKHALKLCNLVLGMTEYDGMAIEEPAVGINELTIDEIAKKFNLKPEQVRIKKQD